MRTRFLATDYAAAGVSPVETLDFVRLPFPHIPPPDYPPFSSNFELCFDEIPIFGVSGEVEKLPIDDALSIFLSDVLPHFLDGAGFEEARINRSKEESEVMALERSVEFCYAEKGLDRSGSEKLEIGVKDGTTSSEKGGNGFKFVQFEIPEMDISLLPLKSTVESQIECLHIFSEFPDADFTMDRLTSELMLHDHPEIQQSVYSVDDISVEYLMEQKTGLLERADSVQVELHSHNAKFPLFEVAVGTLGCLGRIYTMDELMNFENIEKQQVSQPDEVINNKELLGSMEFDLIKYLLDPSVATQCIEHINFSAPLDYISIVELSHCQEYSTLHHGRPHGDSIWSMDPILFDEISFFDLDLYQFCEVFSDSAKEIGTETCESMFGEAMQFRSFSELIVCHELTLMDDSFKSLPVPIFPDHGNTSSLHTLVEELLTQLDWQSSSALDGLYLDWHFLGEDDCQSPKYSSCWKMLEDMDAYSIDINLTDSGKLILDFILSEGHSNKSNAENYKENLNLSCRDVPIFNSSDKEDLSSMRNHGDGKRINVDNSLKTSAEKVQMFGESMSSDLEFFLNPRNYVTVKESIPADKSVDNTVFPVPMPTDDFSAANATTGVQQKWTVKVQQVRLSDNILLLIDCMWKNFLAMLGNNKELIQTLNEYQASNDLTLLSLSNEDLKRCFQEKNVSDTFLAQNDDDIMVLAMLCAIKQMAFYLCYYGIQVTYLHLDKLFTSLQCVKSRLSYLYNMIRDENQKAEKELSITHPSIPVLQEILQTNMSNSNSKILIVSDQVFWWPLKRLLISLKISYNEPQNLFTSPYQQHHYCEITDSMMDIMLNSDCCLVSHEYVSASFPFSKFSFIVEYGGSDVSSRISSICPKLDGLPTLYFLKVELDESSTANALCHGANMPKSINLEMKSDLGSTSAQKESTTKLEELLNTIPIKETYGNKPVEAVNKDKSCSPIQSVSVDLESNQHLSCKTFFPDIVIIVNTRNFNEEMVISRRSTYQRILKMEQEGAQIVERDIGLPVDLIVSSAVCLTWYDCRNIGKKASAPDEGFSCLPLCVESIAASILTSLSFAFSCCILIFEGESNFLYSIMESSDELYAAAASLGIDIQLFCSYSSEMTEEIILSCINVAAELIRGLYPKMLDSESLAESFVTSFPSINPLSAHAILSSDAILGKFLELSKEGRVCALQKYQVPDESIALLTALSKYGEREDSKSGMTDCSSSVSVPDSENSQFKSASERKKPKYTHELYNGSDPPNDLFHMESLKLLPDDQLNLPKLSTSSSAWLSRNAGLEQFSLSFDDKLPICSQDIDADMMGKYIDKSSLNDFPLSKGLHISDKKAKSWMPRIDIDCSPGWRTATTAKNNFSRQSINVAGIPHEKFTGEVIDVDNTTDGENFPLVNSSSFSPFLFDVEKDNAAKNSRIKRPLGATNLSMFANPIDINASRAWVSRNDEREDMKPHFDTMKREKISMMAQKVLVEDDIVEKAPQNLYKSPFQEKGTQILGGTPLSNALHSTQLQQGSPWTIEFLNRIREKSRLRKQSTSYDLSSLSFGSSGNTSKVTKRKSPSILEFYKYQGGSTPQKIIEQKRLKRSSQPVNSLKNQKAPASCPSSWTPVDKRARRTLSFSTNESGGQSKLIWRDSSSHTTQRRL